MKYSFRTTNFKVGTKGLGVDEKSTTESDKHSSGESVESKPVKKRYSIEFITHGLKTELDFFLDDTIIATIDAYSEEEALECLYRKYSNLHQSRIEIVMITERPIISNFWLAC